MKKYLLVTFLSLIFTASCAFYFPILDEPYPPEEEYYEDVPVEAAPALDSSYFYDYLNPYGIWINHRTRGYVWIPHDVPYGWRPYTQGHWVWSDYGWTWRSQLTWGWAPFHYGRWGWDRGLGWFWAPGAVWGPGWVTWRSSNSYIGWAPLPPGVAFNAGIGIRRLSLAIPSSSWIFVDGGYFLNRSVHRYIFPVERNVTIINYTVHKTNIYVQNNRVINGGIQIDRVRRITKKNIVKHTLRDTKKAELRRIGSGRLEVYRPKIKKSKAVKPKSVVKREDVQERISRVKTSKPDKKVTPAIIRRQLRDNQKREVTNLERSQQREIRDLKRKVEERKKSARTKAEKKKIDKEHKEKASKLKKTHEKEKSQVKTRHKKETEKAKKEKKSKKEIEEEKKKKKKIIKK